MTMAVVSRRHTIRFKNQGLASLRSNLLEDLSREAWAILLGKTEEIDGQKVIKVYDVIHPGARDYVDQRGAFLRLKKKFVHRSLVLLKNRVDLDTMIDVHTHPFCPGRVGFSSVDDADERQFFAFLRESFDGLTYASIVLSQTEYSSRVWEWNGGKPTPEPARIRVQTFPESILSSDDGLLGTKELSYESEGNADGGMFHRTALTVGLSAFRIISSGQAIAIIGIGGLGSIVAEHLVHMGFRRLVLIDPDVVEISNLSRVVGAYYSDAGKGVFKVDAIARHLRRINPSVEVTALRSDVRSGSIEAHIADCDWIIVATDNHSSRHWAQHLSVKFFVPLISVGVNISVGDGLLEDMSGEVITARVGDNLCLNCLGRINYIKVASESHFDDAVREGLVSRGYVTGASVQEPAVKTLNCIVATMAVDVLINQYTEAQRHVPILVYENNARKCIYEDGDSLARRNIECFTCCIA